MGHIYQIRNIINNAVYIGSVLKREPRHRWNAHKRDLRGNYHHSKHLQRAWNKYGETNFVFEVLEKVGGNVIPREQWYLDDRKNNYPPSLTYNVCFIAGNCEGRKFTPASLKKMSLSHIGQQQTPEARAKQQEAWAKKCKTPYSFTDPNGKIYDNILNLRAFCREHPELDNGSLRMLDKGKIRYYKKWTKTGIPAPLYELYSPDGYYSQGMILKELCVKGGINYKMIHKYCIKQGKPYRGWTAKQVS